MRIAVDAEELLALQFGTPANVVNGTLRAGLRPSTGRQPDLVKPDVVAEVAVDVAWDSAGRGAIRSGARVSAPT